MDKNSPIVRRITYTIKKRKFIEYLTQTCNVKLSCKLAGVDRSDMYKLRKKDPDFALEWKLAIEIGVQRLEDEVIRRAFEGELVTTKHGTYRKYSDRLAIFMLKALRPEKYRDNYRRRISAKPNKPSVDLSDPKIAAQFNAVLNKAMEPLKAKKG